MSDFELDLNGTLEIAMISAIFMITEMDEALTHGCADIVPEEILAQLEATAPPLLAEGARDGLREQLLEHLATYGLLRTIVPDWLDLETFCESHMKVYFNDLMYVLHADGWSESHPEFYSLFMSIAPVVERRIDEPITMEF